MSQFNSDDEYEDASNDIPTLPSGSSSELHACISETSTAINLFFNNQFNEAKRLLQTRSATSMYHALGLGCLHCLEAVMTFQPEDMKMAMESIKQAINLCNRCRKKSNLSSSVGQMLGFSTPTPLTDEELHAEVIFAELTLFHALMTFIQDEDLISLVRGALKIRTGYQTFKYCQKLCESPIIKENTMVEHFVGATSLGCGAFNICLSLLPARILSLLKWIGFTSNKQQGLQQLDECFTTPNLVQPLASIFILSYHLYVAPFVGSLDSNFPYAETILSTMLGKYPNGIYFHFFAGRMEMFKGNYEKAVDHLNKAATMQDEWKQFAHFCYWELIWTCTIMLDWEGALKYSSLLLVDNKWSKCIYTYLKASCLYMLDRDQHRTEINQLMRKVPELRQKIAGKSIPMEKFVARKARKYFQQGEKIMLPMHEMFNLLNGLNFLRNNPSIRTRHLELLSKYQLELEENRKKHEEENDIINEEFNYHDDYCLLQLMKGILLKTEGNLKMAELCLNSVVQNHINITKDHYLTPCALAELAAMFIQMEKYQDALNFIRSAKKNYSNYSMESRVHFRLQAALIRIKEMGADCNSVDKV